MKAPTLFDIIQWDDSQLIQWRHQAITELEKIPDPRLRRTYDASTTEINNRQKRCTADADAITRRPPDTPAPRAQHQPGPASLPTSAPPPSSAP